VFYGPSAVVFTRKDIPLAEGLRGAGPGIEGIKNITQALLVFEFAVRVQDWQSARKILADMRERFKCPNHRTKVQGASDWMEKRLGRVLPGPGLPQRRGMRPRAVVSTAKDP
jgi:hypothetical protein